MKDYKYDDPKYYELLNFTHKDNLKYILLDKILIDYLDYKVFESIIDYY